jgi:ectoine hydroxylase-related dioxygenase (phytanoyl-CoA dioxygenase family)
MYGLPSRLWWPCVCVCVCVCVLFGRAFVVEAGAGKQELHADRLEHGRFLSCQLALHDTPRRGGGLVLWPGSAQAAPSGAVDAERRRRAAGEPELEAMPLLRGDVVCYDGRLWHRGDEHTEPSAPTRRALCVVAPCTSSCMS